MDRLTLDQEGARTGEISASSMQIGNATVTIRNIAPMPIADVRFKPYDTEKNRGTVKMYYGLAMIAGLLLVCGVLWWMITGSLGAGDIFAPAVITLISALIFGAVLWRAVRLSTVVGRSVPYHRLLIGASDGRQVTLVDDNKAVLEQIRDVLRHKVDTNDARQTAKFDLNKDEVLIEAGPL